MVKETEDFLDKANILTMNELEKATINRDIPTAITDPRASTTCFQPVDGQMQESECGGYRWEGLLTTTNKKSDTSFQIVRSNIAPGEEVAHLNALPLI